MATPEQASMFIEAAKVARSFVSKLGQHVPFLIASLAVCIFLFFAPDSTVPASFNEWRWVFAGLGIFLSIYYLVGVWFVRRPYGRACWHLKHIGEDEKVVLRPYLHENKAVRYFPIDHGPACSLVSRGILFAAGMAPYGGMPFAIQPKILVYLRKHPELLGLTRDQIGTKKLTDERSPEATFASENET